MSSAKKPRRAKPRRPKGFRDITATDVLARDRMISRIRQVYERYGFIALETPTLEYADLLGKFLPEADRPDAGIFAFQDDDQEWVALRYDLTAPLSRYVAMHLNDLPLPFRRYQVGPVYRVEKPGPGRYREFYQFDFDSIGAPAMLADAECCQIMCDTLEALGIKRGDFIVKLNNRKVLNGVIESMFGSGESPETLAQNVLRQVDKLDRLGISGVEQLLGQGRKDASGAFIQGLGLEPDQVQVVLDYLSISGTDRVTMCDELAKVVGDSAVGREGVDELREIDQALTAGGFGADRVIIDPTVVRGLAYYTGPVFEGVLTFSTVDEKGRTRQFGSVFGGGRYDGLIERFTGQKIPATGASIGVDRLLGALQTLGALDAPSAATPVLVTRIDRALSAEYQNMAMELRNAGVNTELYVGKQGMGKQFKYASDSGKTLAVIMGSDEFDEGEVSIKDLRLGVELARRIGPDRKKWLEDQPAQFSVPRHQLVESVQKVLARYRTD